MRSVRPLAKPCRLLCLRPCFFKPLLLCNLCCLPCSAAVPFDEAWRVEVKVRATGTSLGTSDAVRYPLCCPASGRCFSAFGPV